MNWGVICWVMDGTSKQRKRDATGRLRSLAKEAGTKLLKVPLLPALVGAASREVGDEAALAEGGGFRLH